MTFIKSLVVTSSLVGAFSSMVCASGASASDQVIMKATLSIPSRPISPGNYVGVEVLQSGKVNALFVASDVKLPAVQKLVAVLGTDQIAALVKEIDNLENIALVNKNPTIACLACGETELSVIKSDSTVIRVFSNRFGNTSTRPDGAANDEVEILKGLAILGRK